MIPRLSVGLPVYNGEEYLAAALDTLLAQTYPDFELVISDNASTDGTEEICRRYARADDRIRYVRQPRNIGWAGNHDAVAYLSRGELFKWASHDDVYAPDLLRACIQALDERPEAVAAHAWTAMIDDSEAVTDRFRYTLRTDSPDVTERFRSLLFDVGGDDDYAVLRTDVLRTALPYGSYYRSDRVLVAALALHGPFRHVPDWLYFRRDHPLRSTRAPSVRAFCAAADPRRADRLRHPVPRLLAEYVGGYVTALRAAPLTRAERRTCYRHLGTWMTSRARPRRLHRGEEPQPESVLVAGEGTRPGDAT